MATRGITQAGRETEFWRSTLTTWRKRRGLTQAGLADASGVSVAAIRAYERSARHPTRDSLTLLIRALGIPRQTANELLAAAGYAVDWQTLFEGRYIYDKGRARSQLHACRWPAFVADQGVNLVASNKAFEVVWDIDLSTKYRDPGARNFMAGASDPQFLERIENFDELVSFLIGLAKGDRRMIQDMENPAPWLREALDRFLSGDPELIARVTHLWETAEPIPHLTRHQYDIRWRWRGERTMHFTGITTVADIWNELSWNDWIPADAQTWETLAEITAIYDAELAT